MLQHLAGCKHSQLCLPSSSECQLKYVKFPIIFIYFYVLCYSFSCFKKVPVARTTMIFLPATTAGALTRNSRAVTGMHVEITLTVLTIGSFWTKSF